MTEFREICSAGMFFLAGLLCCFLIHQAELCSYIAASGKKKYNKNGIIYYFLVLLFLELYIILLKPYAGMAGLNESIFNRSTEYNTTLFSLNGLYTDEAEPLFLLWCYLIRSLTSEYKIFLIISDTIIFTGIIRFISNNLEQKSSTIFFIMIVPVIVDMIFGIRYGLSITYCLNAMVELKNRKYAGFVFFTVLAVFTHFLALGFVLYLITYFILSRINKKRNFSFKTLILLLMGMIIFSKTAYSIYMTFRVSYRAADEVKLTAYVSYIPYVIFTFAILYMGKFQESSVKRNLCIVAACFNTVMIPVTIQWGIYRLPYIFIFPLTVELANCFPNIIQKKTKGLILIIVALTAFVFAMVKIFTMGVQNCSLYPEWIF